MFHKLSRFAKEFVADIRNQKYDVTEGGILLKHSAVLRGTYIEGIAGRPDTYRAHRNLIPDQGILKILGIALYTDSKITTYYLAPFSGSTTPAASLTAANVTSTQTEITSSSEGYSESVRQTWTPATPASNAITNAASEAEFTIVTASSLTIRGAFLASAQAKGATTGSLISCVKFGTARTLNDTDVWGLTYAVSLSDS